MGFRQLLGVLCLVGATAGAAAGDLVVVGTGDGMDVLRAVGAAYTADNPETSVFVPPSVHSSGGISAVRTGAATLGRIARPLTLEERAEGIIEIPVFRLPSVFIVNRRPMSATSPSNRRRAAFAARSPTGARSAAPTCGSRW